jgi:hypothetical protein
MSIFFGSNIAQKHQLSVFLLQVAMAWYILCMIEAIRRINRPVNFVAQSKDRLFL